jgi:glycosyltransferase involved in cell wall biosynthesis
MRIMHVTDLYPPFVGGLELAVQTMSEELARRGHEVDVVTQQLPGPKPPTETTKEGPLVVHRLPGVTRLLTRNPRVSSLGLHPAVPDPSLVRRIRRLVDELQPDVMHTHGWIAYSALLAARPETKVVVGLHDYGLVCAKKTLLRGARMCPGPRLSRCLPCATAHYGFARGPALVTGIAVSKDVFRRADSFVVSSEAVADALIDALPPGREVLALHGPTPETAPSELRPSFLPEEDGFALFVGTLSAHKGIEVLLDAKRRGLLGDRHLVLIGALRRGESPTSYPPGTTVRHDVPHAEVLAAMAAAGVMVVPSLWPEPFGLVAVEAMRQGTPVVASAIGGLAGIVEDGVTGRLVPPGDAEALGAAVREVTESPELSLRMAEAGRRRAERYTTAAVVDELERLYGRLTFTCDSLRAANPVAVVRKEAASQAESAAC